MFMKECQEHRNMMRSLKHPLNEAKNTYFAAIKDDGTVIVSKSASLTPIVHATLYKGKVQGSTARKRDKEYDDIQKVFREVERLNNEAPTSEVEDLFNPKKGIKIEV